MGRKVYDNNVLDHATVAIAAKSLASEMNDLTEQTHGPTKPLDDVVSRDSVTSFKDDDRIDDQLVQMTSSYHCPDVETEEELAGAVPYPEDSSHSVDDQRHVTADVRWYTSRVEPEGASGDDVKNDSLKINATSNGVTVMQRIAFHDDNEETFAAEDELEVTTDFERQVLSELDDIWNSQMCRNDTVVVSSAGVQCSSSQPLNNVVANTTACGTTVVYVSSRPQLAADDRKEKKCVDAVEVPSGNEQICYDDDHTFSDDDQRIVLPLPKRKTTYSSAENLANTATNAPDWEADEINKFNVSDEDHVTTMNPSAIVELKQHQHDVTEASHVYNFHSETRTISETTSGQSVAASMQPGQRSGGDIGGQSRDATPVENANNLRQIMFAARRNEPVKQTVSRTEENSDDDKVILPPPKRMNGESSIDKPINIELLKAEQYYDVNCAETCDIVTTVRPPCDVNPRDKLAKCRSISRSDDDSDNELDTTAIEFPLPKPLVNKYAEEADLPLRSSSPALQPTGSSSQLRASPLCDIVVTSHCDEDVTSQCSDEHEAYVRKADDSFNDVIQQHVDSFLDAFVPGKSKYAESSNGESDCDSSDMPHDYSSNDEESFDENDTPHHDRFYFEMKARHRSSFGKREHHLKTGGDDIGSGLSGDASIRGGDDVGIEVTSRTDDSGGRGSSSPERRRTSSSVSTNEESRNSSPSPDKNKVAVKVSPLPTDFDFSVQPLRVESTSAVNERVVAITNSPPVVSRLFGSTQNSEDHEAHDTSSCVDEKEPSDVQLVCTSVYQSTVSSASPDKSEAEVVTSEMQQRDFFVPASSGKSDAEVGDVRKLDDGVDRIKFSAAEDNVIHGQLQIEPHTGYTHISRDDEIDENVRTNSPVQSVKVTYETRLSAEPNRPEMNPAAEKTEQFSVNRTGNSDTPVFEVTSGDISAKQHREVTESSKTVVVPIKMQSVDTSPDERPLTATLVSRDSHDNATYLTQSGGHTNVPLSRDMMSAHARQTTNVSNHVVEPRTRRSGLQFVLQPRRVVLVEMDGSSRPASHESRDAVEHKIGNSVARDGDAFVTNVTPSATTTTQTLTTSTAMPSVQSSQRQTSVDSRRSSRGSIADTSENVDQEEFSTTLLRLKANLKSNQSRAGTTSTRRFTASGSEFVTVRTKVASAD